MRDYIADAAEGKRFHNRNDFIRTMKEAMGAEKDKARDSHGSLTDITSSRRLGLIYDFQRERMSAEIFLAQADDPDHRFIYPALELVRKERREVPRDWIARWTEAGGELRQGRMVALRDDPIWSKISRFGSPVPPFDFNSGMGLEEIDIEEAQELGLQTPEYEGNDESGEEEDDELNLDDLPDEIEFEIDVPAPELTPKSEKELLEVALEENTAEVAETLGVEKGEPMNFKDANEMRANPHFEESRPYQVNCQSCVVANELRRRGLDVEACAYVNEGLQRALAFDESVAWRKRDGSPPEVVRSGKIGREKDAAPKALDAITEARGRYFVTVAWSQSRGHVFTAERLKDGTLRLYDPQNGKKGNLKKGFEEYFSGMKKSVGFRVLRVDDLVVAPKLFDAGALNLRRAIRESQSS